MIWTTVSIILAFTTSHKRFGSHFLRQQWRHGFERTAPGFQPCQYNVSRFSTPQDLLKIVIIITISIVSSVTQKCCVLLLIASWAWIWLNGKHNSYDYSQWLEDMNTLEKVSVLVVWCFLFHYFLSLLKEKVSIVGLHQIFWNLQSDHDLYLHFLPYQHIQFVQPIVLANTNIDQWFELDFPKSIQRKLWKTYYVNWSQPMFYFLS